MFELARQGHVAPWGFYVHIPIDETTVSESRRDSLLADVVFEPSLSN